jgi:hypothetical protein
LWDLIDIGSLFLFDAVYPRSGSSSFSKILSSIVSVAKLSQAAIKTKADEWAAKLAEIRKLEAAKEKAIAPIVAQHEEELRPFLAKYDPKIEQLQAEAAALHTEVIGWLNEREAPIHLETDKAIAARSTVAKVGPRVASVKRFLEVAKSKGESMYECLDVLIANAEKLLGKKELDQICTRPATETTTCTLKLKDR